MARPTQAEIQELKRQLAEAETLILALTRTLALLLARLNERIDNASRPADDN
jgi:uncharacterized coiled-coil protein SlyX